MENQKKVSFLLDDDLYSTLQKEADRESISVSALIRRLLIKAFQPERMIGV